MEQNKNGPLTFAVSPLNDSVLIDQEMKRLQGHPADGPYDSSGFSGDFIPGRELMCHTKCFLPFYL